MKTATDSKSCPSIFGMEIPKPLLFPESGWLALLISLALET